MPVSQVLGTYTGSWTNQTFGSTGSAVIQILDIARSAVGEDLKVGIVTDERIALGSPAGAG